MYSNPLQDFPTDEELKEYGIRKEQYDHFRNNSTLVGYNEFCKPVKPEHSYSKGTLVTLGTFFHVQTRKRVMVTEKNYPIHTKTVTFITDEEVDDKKKEEMGKNARKAFLLLLAALLEKYVQPNQDNEKIITTYKCSAYTRYCYFTRTILLEYNMRVHTSEETLHET